MKNSINLVLILIIFLLSGCARLFYVKSELIFDGNEQSVPEIISSPDYKGISLTSNKVAIKAPDKCIGKSSSVQEINISSRTELVSSNCGVEMGIIERRLAAEGYSVYSWKMIENMVANGNKTYLEAATELGAEVLFNVNNFEVISANSINDVIKRSFFGYDNMINEVVPKEINRNHKNKIIEIISPYEKVLLSSSLGSTIDVTAIEVKTGKSFWFYKHSVYDLKRIDNNFTAVIAAKKNRWWIYMINGERVGSSNQGSSEYVSVSQNDTDKNFDKYIEKAVVGFVLSFKSGGAN